MLTTRLILAATFSLIVVASARSQAASDYFAYPDRYADAQKFMRDSRQLSFNRMPGLSMDYRIGAGDVIMMEVVGLAEMDHRATVDNRGYIRVPSLGDIEVEGRTAEDLEGTLGTMFVEKKLIREPEILVHILEYFAKPYYVVGEIDRPGEYTMTQAVTLMDALLIAGGFDSTAATTGYLHRRIEPGSPPEAVDETALLRHPQLPLQGTKVIPFDLNELKVGGVLENNPVLQRNDVVVIPRSRTNVFYVVGDVTTPGAYEIEENADLSVGQAIAQAGGPLKTAKRSQAVLIRKTDEGQQINIPIDFKGLLLGRADDVGIRRNDVVFVPGSATRTVGYGMLGQLPGTAQRSVTNRTRTITGGQ